MNRAETIHTENIENENTEGMYYEILANKYRNMRKFILVFLAVFLVFMIVFGYKDMKFSNFRYLFKYQSINAFTLNDVYADVIHSAGNGASFALYKGDLAVLGEDKIALYRLDDELIYKDYTRGENHTLVAGNTYFAVYPTGGKTLSLYDSFSLVHEASFEFPVGLVSLCDSGAYAVYTKEKDSTVTVYNESFSEVFRKTFSDRVVLDMAFSADGDRLAVLSVGVENGSFDSELRVFDVDSEDVLFTKIYPKKQAVDVEFFSDGKFFVSVGGTLCFYDRNGDEETEIFGFSSYAKEENRIASYSTSGAIDVLSSEGKVLWSTAAEGAVSDIRLFDGAVYTVGDARVYVHREESDPSYSPVAAGVLDFFVAADGSVILCYAAQTARAVP